MAGANEVFLLSRWGIWAWRGTCKEWRVVLRYEIDNRMTDGSPHRRRNLDIVQKAQGYFEKRFPKALPFLSQVERRFLDYLSLERVGSGQAVNDAEELVESQQRAEIIGETIVKAWNHIVETPDELLVNLIAETTERICGFKPEPELVEQFLSRHVRALSGASPPAEEPPRGVLHTPTQVGGQRPIRTGQDSTLPIILEPADSRAFLAALLQTKEAWIEEFYTDGHGHVLAAPGCEV